MIAVTRVGVRFCTVIMRPLLLLYQTGPQVIESGHVGVSGATHTDQGCSGESDRLHACMCYMYLLAVMSITVVCLLCACMCDY